MSGSSRRGHVVVGLLAVLRSVRPGDRALIALDGFDGVGKTHLARELLESSADQRGRPVFSVSIDGFHRSKAEARCRGDRCRRFLPRLLPV